MITLTKRDQRRLTYRQGLFDYGFLVLTMLIDYFAESEDFEESQLIKEVIEEINEELRLDYPTEYGDKALDYYENLVHTQKGSVPVNYKSLTKKNMYRLLKVLP